MFCLGARFNSFQEFEGSLDVYSRKNHVVFTIQESKTAVYYNKHHTIHISEKLKYQCAKFACKHYGNVRPNKNKTGARPNQSTYKLGCRAYLTIRADTQTQQLVIIHFIDEHNHACDEEYVQFFPERRRLVLQEAGKLDEIVDFEVKPSMLQKAVVNASGKCITSQDIFNFRERKKKLKYTSTVGVKNIMEELLKLKGGKSQGPRVKVLGPASILNQNQNVEKPGYLDQNVRLSERSDQKYIPPDQDNNKLVQLSKEELNTKPDSRQSDQRSMPFPLCWRLAELAARCDGQQLKERLGLIETLCELWEEGKEAIVLAVENTEDYVVMDEDGNSHDAVSVLAEAMYPHDQGQTVIITAEDDSYHEDNLSVLISAAEDSDVLSAPEVTIQESPPGYQPDSPAKSSRQAHTEEKPRRKRKRAPYKPRVLKKDDMRYLIRTIKKEYVMTREELLESQAEQPDPAPQDDADTLHIYKVKTERIEPSEEVEELEEIVITEEVPLEDPLESMAVHEVTEAERDERKPIIIHKNNNADMVVV